VDDAHASEPLLGRRHPAGPSPFRARSRVLSRLAAAYEIGAVTAPSRPRRQRRTSARSSARRRTAPARGCSTPRSVNPVRMNDRLARSDANGRGSGITFHDSRRPHLTRSDHTGTLAWSATHDPRLDARIPFRVMARLHRSRNNPPALLRSPTRPPAIPPTRESPVCRLRAVLMLCEPGSASRNMASDTPCSRRRASPLRVATVTREIRAIG